VSPAFWVSFGLLWVIVLFQGAVLLEVVQKLAERRSADSHASIGADPLPPGTRAPAFHAPRADTASALDSRSLLGRRVLLAFTAPGCPTCEVTFDSTVAAAQHLDAELIIVCGGQRDACRGFAQRHQSGRATVCDTDGAIAKAFRVHSTPVSVAVDEQWQVIKYGAPSPGDVASPIAVIAPSREASGQAAR
jgi:peroxiredoxin